MAAFGIMIAVARANPAIIRTFRIAEDASVQDLVTVSKAALELDGGDGDCTIDGQVFFGSDRKLSDLLFPGKTALISIPVQDNTVKLWMRVFDRSGEALNMPRITGAIGSNLPEGSVDPERLNSIRRELNIRGVMTGMSGGLIRKGKEFSEKRSENALRRVYRPETVKEEVDYSLGIPLRNVLNCFTVDDLRNIAERFRLYSLSGMRKAEIISTIAEKLNNGGISDVFEQLSIREYQDFRRLAFGQESKNGSFFTLREAGLIADGKYGGIQVASEALEFVGRMVENGKENALLHRKKLSAAARFCLNMYGVFSLEIFQTAARKLDTYEDREIARFWEKLKTGEIFQNAESLQDTLIYDNEVFRKVDEAARCWNCRAYRPENFWLPEAARLIAVSEQPPKLSDTNAQLLSALIRENWRGYYYGISKQAIYDHVVYGILQNLPNEEIASRFLSEMSISANTARKEEAANRLGAILDVEKQTMPRFDLCGYRADNCPAHVLQINRERANAYEQWQAMQKQMNPRRRGW